VAWNVKLRGAVCSDCDSVAGFPDCWAGPIQVSAVECESETVQISAGAIISTGQQNADRKPTYRDYWLLPGGHVEEGELPREAVKREVEEEIGLSVRIGPLLSIDFWWKGTEVTWQAASISTIPPARPGGSTQRPQLGHCRADAGRSAPRCSSLELLTSPHFSPGS
jgi:hypothetical protein